jgi:hypothetical protein
MSNISAESNTILKKSRVTGPWDHKLSVSAKKVEKMSCLCTFNNSRPKLNFLYMAYFEENLFFSYSVILGTRQQRALSEHATQRPAPETVSHTKCAGGH